MDRTANNSNCSRTLTDYFRISFCGFAMGCADVVPGVSGGTMAFILGIYEELIDSIRSFTDVRILKLVITFQVKELMRIFPWRFLVSLGLGMVIAILSLAKALEWTLENHPVLLWSFFFGLVLASVFTLAKRVENWKISTTIGTLLGSIAGYTIVGMVPLETPNTGLFLFFCGCIAICAMILPGISGSFILVLLGKYEYVLSAVNNRDFLVLFIFASGCGVGILSFAHVLSWLLKRYHEMTIAVLIGLLFGSLRKIWPWKETIKEILDRHGKPIPIEEINVIPAGNVIIPLLLLFGGFIVVFILERCALSKEPVSAGVME